MKYQFNKNPFNHVQTNHEHEQIHTNKPLRIGILCNKHNPTTCQKGSLITNSSIHDLHAANTERMKSSVEIDEFCA